VSPIKKKEGTGVKRVNINIPTELHNSFKAATAAQGLEMTVVLLEFIKTTSPSPDTPPMLTVKRNVVIQIQDLLVGAKSCAFWPAKLKSICTRF
jgi:hypothetical protein